jgi:hypothetical protein
MANSAYFNGTGSEHPFTSGQSLSLDFDDPNLVELAFQQRIGQQDLSPTMSQRHDSMFQCSPTVTSRPLTSHHQAESQPYTNIHGTQHSLNGYSHLPVNNMSRSTSQVSHTSSGQHQQSGNLHRSSHGSFGSNPQTSVSEVSRSIFNASASYQVALQPYATQPRPRTVQHDTRQPPDLTTISLPNLGYGQIATNTMDTFNFDPNDIIGGSLGDDGFGNRTFGQTVNTNE